MNALKVLVALAAGVSASCFSGCHSPVKRESPDSALPRPASGVIGKMEIEKRSWKLNGRPLKYIATRHLDFGNGRGVLVAFLYGTSQSTNALAVDFYVPATVPDSFLPVGRDESAWLLESLSAEVQGDHRLVRIRRTDEAIGKTWSYSFLLTEERTLDPTMSEFFWDTPRRP